MTWNSNSDLIMRKPRRLLVGTLRHFFCDLHADLLGVAAEGGDFVEALRDFLLGIYFCVCAGGIVVNGAVYPGGGVGIETLGDDDAIVSPVFHDDRSFFGRDLHARYWAIRAGASRRRLSGCGVVAKGNGAGIKTRETLRGLRRLPS